MKNSRSGVTLIELVVIIVVLGLAIPVLLTNWANVAWRSVRSEGMTESAFFAQELLEEMRSKRFDEQTIFPWTDPASFSSADPGENKNDRRTFDDIDDYVQAADPWVTVPIAGYMRSATVEYANLSSSGVWQQCPLPNTCSAAAVTDCASCDQCCYKRITVRVSRADRLIENVTMSTIMAGY
jgi:type II secretory pathway pseudopilin PulG